MDGQKDMAKMQHDSLKATVDAVKASSDGIKSRVDELHALKNMILGGALVIGVVISILGFALPKIWDYYFKSKSEIVAQTAPPAPIVIQPAPSPPPAPKQ